jgi:hypothetical protein
MRLADIAGSSQSVELEALSAEPELARELQDRLANAGLLDPPADGKFGPVSRWALREFKRIVGSDSADGIDPGTAAALASSPGTALAAIQETTDLAGRLVTYIRQQDHWLARHPDAVNIVYVEGMDPDGKLNDNPPNEFNDLRLTIRFTRTGRPQVIEKWEGTTEPGKFFTENPLNPGGAARIAFGQYKAWAVGTHHPGKASAHEALVQVDTIRVYRDLNRDFSRTGDQTDVGSGFAVNQHWGYDLPHGDLGQSSAGCLVGRTKSGHREFMRIVKGDPRFRVSTAYRFMTTVIDGRRLS